MADLNLVQSLPDGFLDCKARDLLALLGGPTLIELPGRREAPLFVSVLLHGNETSGLEAVQMLLRNLAGRDLPRSLMVLVGNVGAAREGLRRLDDQPDYNRVWPGTVDHLGTPEAALMSEVHDRVVRRDAFAAIDLHNNTGHNPHYGVVCSLDPHTLHLATLFSRKVVWFRGLPGTQTASFAGRIPAMTAECGQPGARANAHAAAQFVSGALDLAEFPDRPVPHHDIDLYHTLAVVRVRPEVNFSFVDKSVDMLLKLDLDRLNFQELGPGTAFGQTSHSMPLSAIAENGNDASAEFFEVAGGTLRLRRPAMPAMLTCDERVIRQDCLCYLMERVPSDMLPPDAIG